MKKKVITATLASVILMSGYSTIEASADEYTVQSGDSLWKISQAYDTTFSNLIDWNSLDSTVIFPGQVLQINQPSHTNQVGVTYTVKSGDVLWKIARDTGVTVSQIKNWNNLTSNMIYPGQALHVAQSSAPSSPTESSHVISTYTVQLGDTLGNIAYDHDVSVAQIKKINNLASNTIFPGQKLRMIADSDLSDSSQSSNLAQKIIADGKKYIGTPYVWGGTSPSGFDCSGFLYYVFQHNGVDIPRTVATIYDVGTPVQNPEVGDIVFFETYQPGASHAGIYVGNGNFMHAGSSTGVTISNMSHNSYWTPRYIGAKSYY